MASEDDSIEQKAAARKEALRALKAAQELSESKEEDGQDGAVEEEGPAMKFRNYVPQDKELQDGKVAPPEIPKFEDPVAALAPAVEKKELRFHCLIAEEREKEREMAEANETALES
ncbi:unnamed protein product [Thlaspi arvense]|uniref:Uncharacterized protein n=1 Tax=Thlaspi arvense TaxID=13288 RepID=A0AAU9RZ48_THLAR|nr:unnamed protein product [Thlaspi arvense]